MSLTRMDAPAISTRGLINVLQMMMPRKVERDGSMYDVGYEAAKRDLAIKLGQELGIDFDINPTASLIKRLKHGTSV